MQNTQKHVIKYKKYRKREYVYIQKSRYILKLNKITSFQIFLIASVHPKGVI